MIDLLVKVLINAAGVYAAIQLVPQISFAFGPDWWKLIAVALILALVNSYLKPLLKMLSFPITLMTMGLFAFVLNAVLLLLVALVSTQLGLGFGIGGFPPAFTSDSFVGALLGSLVISIVATILGTINAGRRIAR